MRCAQELYGHINCDRDVIKGEKFCKFHFVPSLRIKITKLEEVLSYYANTEIYRRPDKDRNGMSGMSAMTDFEIDDGEWKYDEKGEKDHYCYGKKAREALKEVGEK